MITAFKTEGASLALHLRGATSLRLKKESFKLKLPTPTGHIVVGHLYSPLIATTGVLSPSFVVPAQLDVYAS